jgi:hypothetical protein
MLIEIVSVTPPYKEGKWTKINLEYVTEGKKTSRKLVDIGESKVPFNVLKEAKAGETYEISMVKSDDGQFWNWTGAAKVEGTSSAAGSPDKRAPQPAPRSNYESPEERTIKQKSIERQVALKAAVDIMAGSGDYKGVIKIAKIFEEYFATGNGPDVMKQVKVAENQPDDGGSDEFQDDIPY